MPGTRICCFHSPKPSKCSKCKFSFLVLLFHSSKRGTSTWRIQDLPHFPFGICTHTHTGAYRDRQLGGTDLALAELGASECPLFSICFTLQNKVLAPIKQGSRGFQVYHCCTWHVHQHLQQMGVFAVVDRYTHGSLLTSRFTTQHWHYTRICSKCLPSELHLTCFIILTCIVICNSFWVLRAGARFSLFAHVPRSMLSRWSQPLATTIFRFLLFCQVMMISSWMDLKRGIVQVSVCCVVLFKFHFVCIGS